jgi:hypothetical protein
VDTKKHNNAYLVARGHPLALGNEGGGLLVDLGLGGGNLVLDAKLNKYVVQYPWSSIVYVRQ